MIHLIYSLLLYVVAVVLSPYLLWTIVTKPKHRAGFSQKLGFFLPRQTNKTIWIHAVSVGEALAAERLIKSLAERSVNHRVIVSATTPTGQEIAREKFAAIATVFYFPFDFGFSARRAVTAMNPAVLAMIDTEIWPNVIHIAKKRGAKVALVNGRISDKSFPGYRRLYWLFQYVLADVSALLMQSEKDGERVIEMGADPARVEAAGNLKFDRDVEPVDEERRAELRASIGVAPDDFVVFLGSVHKGEEAAIRAVIKVRESIPSLRLVIAPRRIENIDWIERALDGSGFYAVRKTSMNPPPAQDDKGAVPIIDTFGELTRLYSVADVAFVGGSLIDHGGQNPLEPAAHGVVCLYGPGMSNFREASNSLIECGAGFITDGEEELVEKLGYFLADSAAREKAGRAAREAVERNRGATEKTVEKILELANG